MFLRELPAAAWAGVNIFGMFRLALNMTSSKMVSEELTVLSCGNQTDTSAAEADYVSSFTAGMNACSTPWGHDNFLIRDDSRSFFIDYTGEQMVGYHIRL